MYNGAKQARGAGGKFGGKVAAAEPALAEDEAFRAALKTDRGRVFDCGLGVHPGPGSYADGEFTRRIMASAGTGRAAPAAGCEDDSFAVIAAAGGPGFARPATPDGVRLHMASLAAKGAAAARPDFEPFVAPRAQFVQPHPAAVADYRPRGGAGIIPVLDERTSVSKHVALILLIIGIVAIIASCWWPGK